MCILYFCNFAFYRCQYNIVVTLIMQVKENLFNKKLKFQCLTLTADVTDVLKSLNSNNNWKNQSIKLNKTNKPIKLNLNLTNRTVKPLKTVQQNPMTQADLDQLFQGKNKVKTEMAPLSKLWNQGKDYIQNVKFLQIQDDWDRLLTGLPENSQQNDGNDMDSKINSLFDLSSKKIDLTSQFKKDYLVGKVIGQGAYASVRIAIYKPLNQKIAIKIYEKNQLKQQQRKKSVRRQIKILQLLNHPNIMRIFDVVETNNHLNIIMEYLSGISLGSYIKSQAYRKVSSEKICRKIIKPLAEALSYLHEKNIAHRDIKLENVILDEQLSPKLIDFGFSTCIESSTKVKIFCGTPSYMAPQIVEKKQYRGQAADIWALGVLLFVTVTGNFPFKGSTDQQLYRKIINCQYPRQQLFCSKQLIDLLNKMLTVSPEQRITALKILDHPWIKNTTMSQVYPQGLVTKRTKRTDSSIDNKKRQVASSRKSREDTYNFNRLTETYKENLKLELKLTKQSPIHSQNNTCTNRKFEQLKNNHNKFLKTDKNIQLNATMGRKQQPNRKPNSKILQLLRFQTRNKHDQKSKNKIRR